MKIWKQSAFIGIMAILALTLALAVCNNDNEENITNDNEENITNDNEENITNDNGENITNDNGENITNDNEENIIPNTPATPRPFNDITAAALVNNITIGWNLGNTLDATDFGEGWLPNTSTVTELETAWGNPTTTKANITAIKNNGFNTIRIPVSWTKAIDADYNIRADWMARVVEVVNYAVDNDMYIILNTHHDEHVYPILKTDSEIAKTAFRKVWEQVAGVFKNYDEKLIFEGLNEPRTKGSAAEWSGGTATERTNLNAYYRIFVDAVRTSGGNNDKRILMITPYAASAEASAMNGLELPADTGSNKLIVSFHAYQPYNFALNTDSAYNSWSESKSSDTSAITEPIDRYYSKFVSKGIPVIIGEFGAMSKNNEADRAAWAEFYVGYAWSKGVKCVWWDNGATSGDGELFGLLNRNNNTIVYPTLTAGMMRGAEGDGIPPPPPGGGTPISGNWTWGFYNDSSNGGTSTIDLSESSGTYTISGNVTTVYQYGFVGWQATPDAATLADLRSATSISFKVKGDGKTYKIQLPTSDIEDYCYYAATFSTTKGVETTVTVNLSSFIQPDWGVKKPFTKTAIQNIQWATNDGALGAFSLTMRDVVIYK